MGERLVAVAKPLAAQLNGLNGSYLRVLQPGDEDTRACTGRCKRSCSLCAMLSEARAMYVLDLEYKSLVDSRVDSAPLAVNTTHWAKTESILTKPNEG